MKVSRAWLQSYFEKPLPDIEMLRDLFTFHAFEVEEVEGDVLDLKVLPDRAAYAMSHRGIAKELSAIIDVPLLRDPLLESIPEYRTSEMISISVDSEYVHRHTAAYVTNVSVGPSPEWLKKLLESVGQRSINNIVDISNLVMLDIGQPNHAFDAGKLSREDGKIKIAIRKAKTGEKITILSGEEYTLSEHAYVIGDAVSGIALDIAGIKGGLASGITEDTKDLFISVGNYDAALLRKSSQAHRLVTDASQRYQNGPSPELTAFGMRDVLRMISDVAGGTLEGVIDVYPKQRTQQNVSVSVQTVREVLGENFGALEINQAFTRLGFPYTEKDGTFSVAPPFERSDLVIPEDLAEEVGRIIGYDKIEPKQLPPFSGFQFLDANFYYGEKIRNYLAERGFSEVYTSVFTKEKGERQAANKVESDTPYLRKSLLPGLSASLKLNTVNRPVLGLSDVKIFELGKVFLKNEEHWMLALASSAKKDAKTALDGLFAELGGTVPVKESEGIVEIDFSELLSKLPAPNAYEALSPMQIPRYTPFSRYPFIARDIAVWTPEGTNSERIESMIWEKAGALLNRVDQFDTFTKDGKTSYAFRLVFLSHERTLTDEEVNARMQSVTDAMNAEEGWQVR